MLIRVQKKLEALLIEELNNKSKKRLIAAVSGGADSVCLLHLLKRLENVLGYELLAISVEHGIRGEESKQDARFVLDLCDKLCVPCKVVSVDVLAYCRNYALGEEEAARILRYQAFSEYAKQQDASIVLAHHMDDNAETMLFQMIRGSGLAGACGMQELRYDSEGVAYLRPLLSVSRKEIEAYLEKEGLDYRTDSTNLTLDYHRNYIRHEIMPRLETINSAAVLHLNKTASYLEEVREYLQIESQKAMESVCCQKEGALVVDILALKQYHIAIQKEVILQAIAHMTGGRKDITSSHVEEVLALCNHQSGRKICLPSGVLAYKEFEYLRICHTKERVLGQSIVVSKEELIRAKEVKEPVEIVLAPQEILRISVFSKVEGLEIPKKTYTKWFDYDKILKGFCIRNRKSGDFFISDVEGHKKKLKTYFIDEKIPISKRDEMWLLADDDTVLWLIGGRISEHLKVTEETTTIIEINYIGGK